MGSFRKLFGKKDEDGDERDESQKLAKDQGNSPSSPGEINLGKSEDTTMKDSQAKCLHCGVELLTMTEVRSKYSQSGNQGSWMGNMADFSQMNKDRDAIGVTCKDCGNNYCSACMTKYAPAHPLTGGKACMGCAGAMTNFSRW